MSSFKSGRTRRILVVVVMALFTAVLCACEEAEEIKEGGSCDEENRYVCTTDDDVYFCGESGGEYVWRKVTQCGSGTQCVEQNGGREYSCEPPAGDSGSSYAFATTPAGRQNCCSNDEG